MHTKSLFQVAGDTHRLSRPINLEQAIKRLMEAANSALKLVEIDGIAAAELKEQLLLCANAATAAHFPYSARCLTEAAHLIQKRMDNQAATQNVA